MEGLYSTLIPAAGVVTVPLLVLLGLGCLLWCRGKDHTHLVRTAVVFLGACGLLFGGEVIAGLFGLTWRNFPARFLCAVILISGILGIWFTLACFLPLELKDLAPVLRWTLKTGALFAAGLLIFCALRLGTLIVVFGFGSEDVVVSCQGQTLVEEESGWLDPIYDYYEYHSPLFRGRERLYSSSYERLDGIRQP